MCDESAVDAKGEEIEESMQECNGLGRKRGKKQRSSKGELQGCVVCLEISFFWPKPEREKAGERFETRPSSNESETVLELTDYDARTIVK